MIPTLIITVWSGLTNQPDEVVFEYALLILATAAILGFFIIALHYIREMISNLRLPADDVVEYYHKMNNKKLREKAFEIANQLREFEANFNSKLLFAPPISSRQKVQQRISSFAENDVENTRKRNAHEIAFKTQFRPKVMAIRNELYLRLGYTFDLDQNLLSCGTSINDAADLITHLGERLP